jgi:hypothetical protein
MDAREGGSSARDATARTLRVRAPPTPPDAGARKGRGARSWPWRATGRGARSGSPLLVDTENVAAAPGCAVDWRRFHL